MADQIEIQLPKTKHFEESTFPVTAYFRDRATKAASIPTTVRYRIDCLKSGAEVRGWTSVTPAANVTISITSSDNQIQDNSSHTERKQIIVQADTGLATQVNGPKVWTVTNLVGIT